MKFFSITKLYLLKDAIIIIWSDYNIIKSLSSKKSTIQDNKSSRLHLGIDSVNKYFVKYSIYPHLLLLNIFYMQLTAHMQLTFTSRHIRPFYTPHKKICGLDIKQPVSIPECMSLMQSSRICSTLPYQPLPLASVVI